MPEIEDLAAMRTIARGGEPAHQAMAAVYEKHFSRLMRNLRMAYPTLSEDDAADFVGQGFINAFTRADSFRGDCALQTWLLRIVRNLVIDHARRDQVASIISVDDSGEAMAAWETAAVCDEPSKDAMRKQLVDCVRRRFAEFRTRHPQPAWALWARIEEEMSPQDLALLLDKTYSATRQYLSGWAQQLRKTLAPCFPHLQPG